MLQPELIIHYYINTQCHGSSRPSVTCFSENITKGIGGHKSVNNEANFFLNSLIR